MKNIVQSFYKWYTTTLRNAKYRWIIVAGTLIYLLSPIDIAPDFIPLIGWIDDGVVVTLLVTEMSKILQDSLNKRRVQRSTQGDDAQFDRQVIDVQVES